MIKRKLLFVILLLVANIGLSLAQAKEIRVKSLADLQNQIDKAVEGTTIVVENGVYSTDNQITVSKNGSSARPITITAQTIGGVEMNGKSGFLVRGTASYIVIKGFKFTHDAGKFRIEAGAKFCRITQNVFECKGDGFYLSVSGDDTQIDHNTFQHKSKVGQMISVQGPGSSGMAQRTWIHHNYFNDFTPVANNCSSIQIGLSGRSLSSAFSIVEYNLFSQTRGENENICNKSCDNIYRFNTFGEGVSELSLRHGNNCQVYGNFFLGSEGVRFYGHNHKIFCNYFEGCNPAINIGNGDGIVPKDKLTSHDRPDSVYVLFNTLLNNKRNIIMQGRNNGLGAFAIVVANNIIQGGNEAFKIDGEIMNPTWAGNMIWKTNGGGNIPKAGYLEADPKLMTQDAERYHLQKDSPAIGNTKGSFPFASIDIDGLPLVSKPNAGADQSSVNTPKNHILTPEEVGPNAK